MTRYGFLKGGEVNDLEILDDVEWYFAQREKTREIQDRADATAEVSIPRALMRARIRRDASAILARSMRGFSEQMGDTYNLNGYAAYSTDDKTTLVTMALTSMLGEPKHYGDNTLELLELATRLCRAGEGLFVAKLAVWTRTQGNLRSVSHALAAVVAHECSGEGFVRPTVRAIARMRGDDGTKLLGIHQELYGNEVRWPHALQRGVRDALSEAGAYDIAKYQSKQQSLTMRDALRMTHPVPRDAKVSGAMHACVEGTLEMPKGWQTELSARGNTGEVWNELLAEGRLGYMAILRNLRNIIASGADVEVALRIIEDPAAVRRSRQLPFRFFSAWRELFAAGMITTRINRALDKALEVSCENVGHMSGKTAILIDTSSSMNSGVSIHAKVSCRDIAATFAAVMARVCDDAWVCSFNSLASQLSFSGESILADIQKVPAYGGCTNMSAAFDCLMQSGFDADRVIVLSDNEVNYGAATCQKLLDEYRSRVGHDVWCHAIDLQGYGTQQFRGTKVNIMAGWSDNVLRFIGLAEAGFGGLVQEIEATAIA